MAKQTSIKSCLVKQHSHMHASLVSDQIRRGKRNASNMASWLINCTNIVRWRPNYANKLVWKKLATCKQLDEPGSRPHPSGDENLKQKRLNRPGKLSLTVVLFRDNNFYCVWTLQLLVMIDSKWLLYFTSIQNRYIIVVHWIWYTLHLQEIKHNMCNWLIA